MITHYVRISNHAYIGDIVMASADVAVSPDGKVSEGWIAVEDAANHADACVRAREYVDALKVLEEPKSYDYGTSFEVTNYLPGDE